MTVTYNDIKKDMPCEQLHKLFVSVGWSDGSETPEMIQNYNAPYINSTIVVSAWADDHLTGAVRVLSDRMFRSVIYDLLVLPEFQNKGIGKELLHRCIKHFPESKWLVQTTESVSGYYRRHGFEINDDTFLTIPRKLFSPA